MNTEVYLTGAFLTLFYFTAATLSGYIERRDYWIVVAMSAFWPGVTLYIAWHVLTGKVKQR